MIARLIAPLVAASLLACAGRGNGDAVAKRSIDDVLAAHTDSLMALPGVVGTSVGLCDGAQCIQVLLADSTAATRSRIPAQLEGYRVVTQVTGTIRPKGSA